MAIVKFVSDKTCQIFVDKEYSGEVNKDSILKLTLEPGGYLIEVKDEDAHLLKKYNLEIKATDNQVLQDVSDEESSLDAVIDQLKNDPSLEFYCNRASFCYKGLYGYVNKRFEVVVPAIYTIANKFKDDKAFVVREFPEGKKTTLIDEDGNMFFNRWFDYIGESDETILFGIENRVIVYSKIKFNKTAEYYNGGYDFKHPYVPVYKKEGVDEFYGFINYKGEEAVPLLFDVVGNFNEKGLAEVYFWGLKSKIDKNDFTLKDDIGNKYEVKSFNDLVYMSNNAIFNEGLDRIEIYNNNRYIFKTVHPLLIEDKWLLQITTEYQNDNSPQEKTIACDKVVYLGERCFVYRIGKQCFAHYFDSGDELIIDAEFVIPANRCVIASGSAHDEYYPDTFIIRKDGKYGSIGTNGKEILPTIYNSIIPIQPNYFIDIYTNLPVYAIIQLGARYSLANLSEGHVLLPFEYDEASLFRSIRWEKKTIFKLRKGTKYQLFFIEEGLLTDEYDDIIFCNKNNIVKKDNKYGIINDLGKVICPIENVLISAIGKDCIGETGKINFIISKDGISYALGNIKKNEIYLDYICDEITVLCSGLSDIFLLKKRGKYGCLNFEGKLLIAIDYDKIEVESHDSSSFPCDSFKMRLYKEGNWSSCIIEV